MAVRKGDRIRVDVAAFTGAWQRRGELVPCEVLASDDARIQVRTERPHRVFDLWIDQKWIEVADRNLASIPR